MGSSAMSRHELIYLSVVDARDLLARRELSAREYISALLVAIDESTRYLRAFIDVYADEALAEAAQFDDAPDQPHRPLAGIPFAVKDLIDARGKPTTAQSRTSDGTKAFKDAAVVRQLREAGAILVGKLSLEECGIGSPLDETPWPPARNPWDCTRTTGGSSSGCGAALAAGLVPIAIGTDTGGSIRHPAASCGVVGLKPTYDRVRREGIRPLAPTLDHVGPMTRTVADCELVLDVLAPTRSTAPTLSTPQADRPLLGWRIGKLEQLYRGDNPADDVVCHAVNAACLRLEDLGAVVVDTFSPAFDSIQQCASTILSFEAFRSHRAQLELSPHTFGERCRRALERGATLQQTEYDHAILARTGFVAAVDELLTSFDLLVTAVTVAPACRIDDETELERVGRGGSRLPFNLTGHPALSICAGFSTAGLPLAVQMIGARNCDETVLVAARAYQNATSWHTQHPPYRREQDDSMTKLRSYQ